jgi:phosphoglucomutase
MTIEEKLNKALQEKKINSKAAAEINRWLTEKEYAEYRPGLIKEIESGKFDLLMDQFYQIVVFGTGGIRGVMDIGTNRINNHIIRRASQAYATFLVQEFPKKLKKGVVIAYDSRNNSKEYATQTARVLAANNVKVLLFADYRPVPECSFALRLLGAIGGIVVTASHNPPEFNGYKVYDDHGIQLQVSLAKKIEKIFLNDNLVIKIMPMQEAIKKGLVEYLRSEIDKKFLEQAKKLSLFPGRDAKIVYSPLHGVGSKSVLPILKGNGFKVITVTEQMTIDGNFPTVPNHFPQPEFPVVYEKAIKVAKKNKADVIIVSDPDADRMGMAIPDALEWKVLTGNQAGILMVNFILERLKETNKLPKKGVVIKTFVTTDLFCQIAKSFGVEAVGDLLVGFKYIGNHAETLPEDKTFIFAAEESVGYLYGNSYRDKGAENAALVVAEMTSYYKAKNKSLLEVMDEIYLKHGYFVEKLYYQALNKPGDLQRIVETVEKIRQLHPATIGKEKIYKILDWTTSEVINPKSGKVIEKRKLGKENVITLMLSEDELNKVSIRPSGTEPKVKIYTSIRGELSKESKKQIENRAAEIEKATIKMFNDILKTVKIDLFK